MREMAVDCSEGWYGVEMVERTGAGIASIETIDTDLESYVGEDRWHIDQLLCNNFSGFICVADR